MIENSVQFNVLLKAYREVKKDPNLNYHLSDELYVEDDKIYDPKTVFIKALNVFCKLHTIYKMVTLPEKERSYFSCN